MFPELKDLPLGLFTKDVKTMNDLFLHQLQDVYYAEHQLVKALQKLARKAADTQLKSAFLAHLDETKSHVQRLEQVFVSGFHGLRLRTGELILILFGIALLLGLARPDPLTCHMVAIAGAALAQYVGPIVLIAGDEPSHYVLVVYPLILLVAVR